MKKLAGRVGICMFLTLFIGLGAMLFGRQDFYEILSPYRSALDFIEQDCQYVKHQSIDLLTEDLRSDLQDLADVELTIEYLHNIIPYICEIAYSTIKNADVDIPAG